MERFIRKKKLYGIHWRTAGKIYWLLGIIPLFIFFVAPIYLTVLSSFKSTGDIVGAPFAPIGITLENYIKILSSPDYHILEMYFNSVLITSISVGLTLLTCPFCGYFLSRSSKKVGQAFTMLFLLGWMVPPQITIVPLMSLIAKLHLVGTYWAVFIIYGGNVFATLLYAKFISTVPFELEEAAYVDGAKKFRVFISIILPLLKPITATIVIFVGLNTWNDFVQPLLVLRNIRTITYGVYLNCNTNLTNYGTVFAFVILASIPVVLLFISMQKLFMSGLTSGAIKG
jgi:raffinose/stachyose/melibiose transport system permease protein